ncbi:hypothetical protein [uncultured Brevundimonas sp.]|uniref:hypothetical protein n=1 Tax=uncultured Brevundimonas sp. TaxID=213418 RepID=UPI0030ED0821|tara:strand:+ start:2915 stop:3583 length:669 start_codon:yes stop_codon:yes gene_type:complete
MPDLTEPPDEQDQSETFDETHIDDEGNGDLLLDEDGPVLDVTRADGDGDDEDDESVADAPDSDRDFISGRIEAAADALLGLVPGRSRRSEDETDDDPGQADDIELVYAGLMREQRGAQASAAHWEARRLDDDDISALGYGPDSDPLNLDRTIMSQSPPHHPTPREDNDPDTPHARRGPREHGKPDQLREDERRAENRQEALIDESIEETFPASDPPTPKHIT